MSKRIIEVWSIIDHKHLTRSNNSLHWTCNKSCLPDCTKVGNSMIRMTNFCKSNRGKLILLSQFYTLMNLECRHVRKNLSDDISLHFRWIINFSQNYVWTINYFVLLTEFDEYYMSLRPRMDGDGCNSSTEVNLPHPTKPNLVINCRNGWFREFWSQHNKCNFDNNTKESKCTGEETISDYEQEGLVPFVGKLNVTLNI